MKAKKFIEAISDYGPDFRAFGRYYIEGDEIGKFWVVTKPSPAAVIEDILFETNIAEMALQFKGGLKDTDIVMITKDQAKAKAKAEELLKTKEDRGV